MRKLYLSRRNLETLLNKLNRKAEGEQTACTIIKYRSPQDPTEYIQTFNEMAVQAVENEEELLEVSAVEDAVYYTNRPAGAMLPQDEPPIRHETGTTLAAPHLP